MKKLLAFAFVFLLLGAGCATSQGQNNVQSETYVDADYGFEVSYPAGWEVGEEGAPGPSLHKYVYFQPQPAQGGDAVNIWIFSEQGISYTTAAEKPDAVTRVLGENFYVINHEDNVTEEDFDLIVTSFKASN